MKYIIAGTLICLLLSGCIVTKSPYYQQDASTVQYIEK